MLFANFLNTQNLKGVVIKLIRTPLVDLLHTVDELLLYLYLENIFVLQEAVCFISGTILSLKLFLELPARKRKIEDSCRVNNFKKKYACFFSFQIFLFIF
jgi:hypothetical protein